MGLQCGVDIIEIERIEASLRSKGDVFGRKIFTDNEIEYCEARKAGKYQSYAVRFAAKEAVTKALGTGISMGIGLKDIEILKDEKGKPYAVLHGKAREIFNEKKGEELSLSLSHCKSYAVAYCVIVTKV